MSSIIIKDGTGSGLTTKVTSSNRLLVDSTSEDIADHAADSGDKFNVNTGDITLTSAAKTSVLYVKNNSDDIMVVTGLIYNLGNSTGGSGDCLIEVIRNPTAGGIVTNANNTAIGTGTEANFNFGSAKTLTANTYKGATGETAFTDGNTFITTRLATSSGRTLVALGAVQLPKGSSIGINYTPQTGNTSQKCQFAITVYMKTSDVGGF